MGAFNPFSKKDWEKEFGKGGKEISKPFEKAANELRKVGEGIKRDLQRIERDVKKEGRNIYGMAGDLKKQIRQVGGDVEGRIENAGREVDGAIRTAGREIDKTFEDRIPEIAQKAIREFASAVTKQGLKKFRNMVRAAHESMQQIADRRPDLVDALDQPGVTFKLGPLTLEWSGFYSRAEGLVAVLDKFVANPPKFRRGPLIQLVESIGPDTIDAGISIELSFVVGSNELGVGGELSSIPLALFTELGDVALDKLGVPE